MGRAWLRLFALASSILTCGKKINLQIVSPLPSLSSLLYFILFILTGVDVAISIFKQIPFLQSLKEDLKSGSPEKISKIAQSLYKVKEYLVLPSPPSPNLTLSSPSPLSLPFIHLLLSFSSPSPIFYPNFTFSGATTREYSHNFPTLPD